MWAYTVVHSVYVILTAAVYIACREAGIKKLREIAAANNTKHKLVAKAYRVLNLA